MASNRRRIRRNNLFRRSPVPSGWRRGRIGHYLVVVEGSEPGKRIELDSAAALTIGRDAKQATMVFPDTRSLASTRWSASSTAGRLSRTFNQRTGRLSTPRAWSPATLKKATSSGWARHALRYERRSRKRRAAQPGNGPRPPQGEEICAVATASSDSHRTRARRVELRPLVSTRG